MMEKKKERKKRADSTIVMLSKYIKRLIDINQFSMYIKNEQLYTIKIQ